MAVEARDFRALMAAFPAGVAVVTAVDGDDVPRGMTCSSLCSVALEPATLLVCMRRGSPTLDATVDRRVFTVHLLDPDGRGVAELFGSGRADRFGIVEWETGGLFRLPHLKRGVTAVADCRVSRLIEVGDHTVVFGEVLDISWRSPSVCSPLLYGLRQYSCFRAGL
jgi:flavin reductase (NADH)